LSWWIVPPPLRRGENGELGDYAHLDAMAMLDRERWIRVQPLLDEALELTDAQRATWLDWLRSTTPDVARDVERLLANEAAADGDGFLTDPLR
jgi:hypothetical protein